MPVYGLKPKKLKVRKCKQCGEPFQPYRANQICCSKKCIDKHRYQHRVHPIC